MTTINIHLSDELQSYLQQEAVRRGYKDASEFVQSLLEAERLRDIRKELEDSLLEAIEGPFTPLTDADFDDIVREGTKIIEKRQKK